MSRTNDLRALILTRLNNLKTSYGVKEITYQLAQNEDLYPHITFDFDGMRIEQNGFGRTDVKLVVDVWDRQNSASLVNNLADAIEDELDGKNIPQTGILPTFFVESRRNLLDEDKLIKHIQIVFNIQNYERS